MTAGRWRVRTATIDAGPGRVEGGAVDPGGPHDPKPSMGPLPALKV